MMRNAIQRRLAIISFALALSACSSDHRDLQNYIDDVKARPGGAIEPLPEIRPAPRFTYQPENRRSPFIPDAPERAPQDVGVGPDLDRPREYLEGQPLDALTMVGTLRNATGAFALVQDADALVHRVTVGNHLGQNFGRIVDITDSEISLLEIMPDGLGGYYERPATIGLSD